jgi:hypothetical protein
MLIFRGPLLNLLSLFLAAQEVLYVLDKLELPPHTTLSELIVVI